MLTKKKHVSVQKVIAVKSNEENKVSRVVKFFFKLCHVHVGFTPEHTNAASHRG